MWSPAGPQAEADKPIHIERGLCSCRGVRPHTVWRQWKVQQKVPETDDAATFVVERTDDRLVRPSPPGQYVTVQMTLPDGTRQPRQYSVSRADNGQERQFTVKRVHGGKPDGQCSTLLHDTVNVGDMLIMSIPFGAVTLDDAAGRPLVFASAGIGITPMAGMLSTWPQPGPGCQSCCCTPTTTRRLRPPPSGADRRRRAAQCLGLPVV